jgi:hypothetical protein
MSIKTLMSAADAAGYAMVSEETLDDMGGDDIAASQVYSKELAVVPAQDGGYRAAVQGHVSSAWNWLAGRFVSGAPA